ncbi:MAG TPA: hypothetical protein VL523_17115 [Terriglobia bacterium]|nr:hypothetical protein [Terriglobia bacterium]
MKSSSWLATLMVAALTFFSPALFASGRAPEAAPPAPASYTDSVPLEVSSLLTQIKTDGLEVRQLSARLQSLDMQEGENYWQYDAGVLSRARTQVNAMDQDLRQLEKLQPEAARWQQKAIGRVAPSVVELTDYTRSALRYLDHHEDDLFSPAYRNDADFMYRKADRIVKSVDNFEHYASARREVRHLGARLEISS